MTQIKNRFSILRCDSYGYYGQTVYDDGRHAVVAGHSTASDGREANRFIHIEPQHRDSVIWIDSLKEFKKAWHQLFTFETEIIPNASYSVGHLCMVDNEPPFDGPSFTTEELNSVSYFSLLEDNTDLLKDVPAGSEYIPQICAGLKKHPEQFEQFITAIRKAGNREAHRARRLAREDRGA